MYALLTSYANKARLSVGGAGGCDAVELVGGWPAGMDEDGAALRTRARRALRGQRAGRLPGMAVLEIGRASCRERV